MVLAVVIGAQAGEVPTSERRSDYELMGPELRRMQDDDSANPGMLWVFDGEALWKRKDGSAGKSCADCHGEATNSMKGVATRYPAFDQALGRPIDLEARINACRVSHQGAEPLIFESKQLLSLTAYVARQSKGYPSVSPTMRQPSPSSPPAGRFSSSGRGSSTSLAHSAMMTIGARNWAAR
jgi:sulfur-oxidizing protein SoxA